MATTTKPATVLSRDQRRRAEALEHARRIILGTVGGPLVVRVANGPCDATDVLRVAGWILDGITVDVVEGPSVVLEPCARCGHPARLHTGTENVPWSGCSGLGGGPDDALPCGCPSWLMDRDDETGPVARYVRTLEEAGVGVDGPRPTLETVPLEDRWLSIPCRKGCVVAALPHAECIDAEGDVLG